MGITKTLLKGAGKGVLAAFIVLMCASLGFAATTIYVNQDATGKLTVTTLDCNGVVTNPANTSPAIPNSCSTPDLFWDSDAGELRLNGFDGSTPPAPKWTGTIDANGNFTTTMSSLPNVTCSSVTPNVVSATFSTTPTVVASQACTSWTYDASWNPSPCAVGTIQTKKATGVPSGCVGGFPDITQMVRSCPAPTCVYTYSGTTCGGTCTPTSPGALTGTCPAAQTGVSPAGCIGGNSTPNTINCTPVGACTGYTYSAWGTCTSGTQSRTVTGYTPAGCSGSPSTNSVLTQSCTTPTPGGPIVLQQSNEYALTLAAKQTQYFQFTTPAGGCSSALHKWIRVTLINVSLTGGDGQLLVKSSNHGASTALPTLADYTYEFGLHSYSNLQDWTRDPNGGVFFWNWSIGGANEVLAITYTYTGHTFNQDDTYYMLLYNQGTTSNQYRVLWQCY